jgi:hypothetical protein
MKNTIFWNVLPCSPVVHRRFEENVLTHLQDRTVSKASMSSSRNMHELLQTTRCHMAKESAPQYWIEELTQANGRHFFPEDGGSTFLRSFDELLSDYTTSHTRREYLLFSIGSKCNSSKQFDPEDGGNMFLRRVDDILSDYTASHNRTEHSSLLQLLKLLSSSSVGNPLDTWTAPTEI